MDFSAYKDKRVLVTGHTGFKGSWLSIWLKQSGAKLIGVALPPTGLKDNYVLTGLSDHLDHEFMQDIRDLNQVKNIFSKTEPEIVFHLAAQSLVFEGYNQPAETFHTNVMGTVNVLEACRVTPSVKTIVMITSDKCYENMEWVWGYRENDRLGGFDPYSASKGASELVSSSYRRSFFNPDNFVNHGKSLSTVRAGNVIGGGDWAENRIVPDCIKSLEQDKPIIVRNPLATRPWQHVLEPLGGYLWLAQKMMQQPEKFSESWNFGPRSESIIPVKDLVEFIIKFYGKGEWVDLSGNSDLHEAQLLALDITKANHRLNWRPVLTFPQTIEMTVDWYKRYSSESTMSLCIEQINKYVELWKSRN